MKTKTPRSILIVLFLNTIILFSSNAWSQKIKVKKSKGNSAIIESTVPLEEGQVYDLATQNISQDVDYKSLGLKSRQHSVSFGGSFYSLKGDNYQRNDIALQGRYGWNFTSLEFGAVVQLSSLDSGAGATIDFTGGGYFDYNLVANRDPKNLIYGGFALISFGSRQFPNSSGGGSATTLDLNLGGFVSWFYTTTVAIRVEPFIDIQQISTTSKQSNVSGLGTRVLTSFYF